MSRVRRVGESRRDDREGVKTPIMISVCNLGAWPLRNKSGSTNPVVLFPVSRQMYSIQVQLTGMTDVAAAIERQVESDKRKRRKQMRSKYWRRTTISSSSLLEVWAEGEIKS